MSNTETKHGWFSWKQMECLQESCIIDEEGDYEPGDSGSIYLTPYGKEVHVTTVSRTLDHGSGWDDIEYVGLVTTWVRKVK